MNTTAFAFWALMGCSDQGVQGGNNGTNGPAPGSISGRVCDPSGRNWLPDAQAYTHFYNADGKLERTVETTSDPDGFWLLDDLDSETEYRVFVQSGDEVLLDDEIYVGTGEDVRLPEPRCFDPNESNVAIITGSYDDFASVLNQMGFANYTLVDGTAQLGSTDLCEGCVTDIQTFLRDGEQMLEYDIILFNGGHIELDVLYDSEQRDLNCLTEESLAGKPCRDVLENVQNFVNLGGSVYASDWAYDLVEIIWPDNIDFARDDTIRNDAEAGLPGSVTASLTDQALAEWLGKEDDPFLAIDFDLNVWPPMESVSESVSVHMSGPVSYQEGQAVFELGTVPLLASFNSGEGKVVYATFPVANNASTDMLQVLQYMMYIL